LLGTLGGCGRTRSTEPVHVKRKFFEHGRIPQANQPTPAQKAHPPAARDPGRGSVS
jgi:hypothetical protein